MPTFSWKFSDRRANVVGSIGETTTLKMTDPASVAADCDLIELRLDLMGRQINPDLWAHLCEFPLLMTSRREDEGGAKGLHDTHRLEMLEMALPDAALVDLEVASIPEAGALIDKLAAKQTPWVASYHDFEGTPGRELLEKKATEAREAGAAAFKVAAMVRCPGDIARLADFQLEDHGIPVATMGMGPMAAVSRLLCAQCGSVLNYGYLGSEATAPGQWSAAAMKAAIRNLPRPASST